MLQDMPRNLRNWTYDDLIYFLKEHGFLYEKPLKGSHQCWIKRGESGECVNRVEVSIPQDSFKPKTMRIMILKSGIAKEEWIKWANT